MLLILLLKNLSFRFRACLALRLRRVSAKQSEKSRQTRCGGRAFGSRAQRDKRANELRAAKTREARSGPRFAYLQPASIYHGPKQALTLLCKFIQNFYCAWH